MIQPHLMKVHTLSLTEHIAEEDNQRLQAHSSRDV
jgi:hypothetical protein